MMHKITLSGKEYDLYNDEGCVILFGESDKRCLAEFGRGKANRLQAGAYIAGCLEGLRLAREVPEEESKK